MKLTKREMHEDEEFIYLLRRHPEAIDKLQSILELGAIVQEHPDLIEPLTARAQALIEHQQ